MDVSGDIAKIAGQEAALVFPAFDEATAFAIGSAIRARGLKDKVADRHRHPHVRPAAVLRGAAGLDRRQRQLGAAQAQRRADVPEEHLPHGAGAAAAGPDVQAGQRHRQRRLRAGRRRLSGDREGCRRDRRHRGLGPAGARGSRHHRGRAVRASRARCQGAGAGRRRRSEWPLPMEFEPKDLPHLHLQGGGRRCRSRADHPQASAAKAEGPHHRHRRRQGLGADGGGAGEGVGRAARRRRRHPLRLWCTMPAHPRDRGRASGA